MNRSHLSHNLNSNDALRDWIYALILRRNLFKYTKYETAFFKLRVQKYTKSIEYFSMLFAYNNNTLMIIRDSSNNTIDITHVYTKQKIVCTLLLLHSICIHTNTLTHTRTS